MKKLMAVMAAVALMGAAAAKWSKETKEEYTGRVFIALLERGAPPQVAESIAACMADKMEGYMSEQELKDIWSDKKEPTDEQRAQGNKFVQECVCATVPEACK